jgi:hypothetical protein
LTYNLICFIFLETYVMDLFYILTLNLGRGMDVWE